VRQRLQELLDELHAELGDSSALDQESRQELRELAQQIEAAVGDEGDDDGIAAQAMEHIDEATVAFESEHPRLAGILSSIADTLAKLGI